MWSLNSIRAVSRELGPLSRTVTGLYPPAL